MAIASHKHLSKTIANLYTVFILILANVTTYSNREYFILATQVSARSCCHCRATTKTADIPLKECSAYGQIDQGSGEREEPHVYELTQ